MTVNFTTWKGITDGQTYDRPDGEDFEHNDLTGRYAGATDQFSIQTETVFEGSYALQGDGGNSHVGIVRTTRQDPWRRYGLRIDWKQHFTSDVNGGLLLLDGQDPSVDSGYAFHGLTDDDNIFVSDWNGGRDGTNDFKSTSITKGSFLDCSLEMPDNGDLIFTIDGDALTINDTLHEDLYLGFHTFRGPQYIDDVQFSTI